MLEYPSNYLPKKSENLVSLEQRFYEITGATASPKNIRNVQQRRTETTQNSRLEKTPRENENSSRTEPNRQTNTDNPGESPQTQTTHRESEQELNNNPDYDTDEVPFNKTNNQQSTNNQQPITEQQTKSLVSRLQKAFNIPVEFVRDTEHAKEILGENAQEIKQGDTIFGFVHNGKIYLNQSELNAQTPIHEFGHIWNSVLKQANPKGYKEAIEVAKRSDLFQELKKEGNYNHLTSDQLAEEALATAIGCRGEELYLAEQNQTEAPKPKNKLEKIVDNIFSWLGRKLGANNKFFKDKKANQIASLTLEEIANAGAIELLGGNEINTFQTKEQKTNLKRLWEKATKEKNGSERAIIGTIPNYLKNTLQELSGVDFSNIDNINISLSNLRHIFLDHFQGNEKDKNNNIPLNNSDIENLVNNINNAEVIIYGKGNNNENVFIFLKQNSDGTNNIVTMSNKKRNNVGIRSVFKTKKDFTRRANEILNSAPPPSGHSLSNAKVVNLSDKNNPKFQIIGEQGTNNQQPTQFQKVTNNELKNTVTQLKRLKTRVQNQAKARKTFVSKLKELISSKQISELQKRELNKILNKAQGIKSQTALNNAIEEVENILLNVDTRIYQKQFLQILKRKYKTNQSGRTKANLTDNFAIQIL